MPIARHSLSSRLFDALAAGGGGPEAIRQLAAAQSSKHSILLLQVFACGQHAAPHQAGQTRRAWELLTAVQRHDRAMADALIRYPSVGAWALRTVLVAKGARAVPGAEPHQLSAVAAAAAIRAQMPAEIEVPVVGGSVVLPSLGAVAATGPAAVIRVDKGGAHALSGGQRVDIPDSPEQDAPGWQGLHRISAGSLDVLIDDLDPFRMPDVGNVAPRLSIAEAGKWGADFQQAWLLLEADHPAVAAEVKEIISVIVPLTKPPEGQVSCSSPQAPGAAALSEPPDPHSCAVTLAHEVQHQKLSALLDIVELTQPEDGRLYYAPWREDPRPLHGLLQGAYAHLGVSSFWRRQRTRPAGSAIRRRADVEFARWRTATARTVGTLLASGQLTDVGTKFVWGMSRQLKDWTEEPVPAEAQAQAQRAAEAHLARWQLANGPISS